MMGLVQSILFPPKCILCGTLLGQAETDLCHSCRQIEAYPKPVDKLPYIKAFTVLWHYRGFVRQSILRYKFSGKLAYARPYGRLLAMRLRQEAFEFDLLTWVPVSALRKWARGYDQVELLAQAVGAELGIKPLKLLKKKKDNPPQSRNSTAAQRRRNVQGVYAVPKPELLQGKRILLLDDVITTGATASEASRTLKQAGAKEVYCAALAAASHNERISR